jgi:glucose-6-phosphate 1-epimerase
MSSVSDLQKRFGVARVVRVEEGRGSLPKISVTGDLASAEIYLHGAHVTHFQPTGAQPLLFMSKSSWFEPLKPIRGGVPLVFPWFGARAGRPESPAHGFARIRQWDLESCDLRNDGSVRVALALQSDGASMHQWPLEFNLRLVVIISRSLEITLEVRNASSQTMDFEEALHTYLSIGDIRRASVQGLSGIEFVDRPDGAKRKVQPDAPIFFEGETDRLYLNTTSACQVHDPVLNRTIRVEKEGSHATVVWNPWIAKAKAMPDFGDEEWPQMLCIEAANAMDCAVKLSPGATHRLSTRVSIV